MYTDIEQTYTYSNIEAFKKHCFISVVSSMKQSRDEPKDMLLFPLVYELEKKLEQSITGLR